MNNSLLSKNFLISDLILSNFGPYFAIQYQ
jgi:hypothetical protein